MKGKVLTFYLQGNLLGIDITLVKEINRNVEFTPVPQSHPHIAGLFNMRGQVVTLMDMAQMLGYKQGKAGQKASCIILKNRPNDPDHTGFLIDKPGDVLDIEEEWCETPPANVNSIEAKYLQELIKLKDKLITVVDIAKMITEKE